MERCAVRRDEVPSMIREDQVPSAGGTLIQLLMVMENRPVDPGSIQGSHRPISFIRNKHTTRVSILQVLRSINNHIVRLVHKKPYFEVLEMKYRRNTSNEHV